MNNYSEAPPERSLGDLIAELKKEATDLFTTRLEMLRSEFHETVGGWKSFLPLAVIAAVLLATAYVLFTLALVSVVVVAFWGNPYHWFFAFLIVGFVWVVIGALVAYFAKVTFRNRGLFPKKSIGVLQADRLWLQMETKGHV
jgi:putative superfamily III holin-X